MADQQTQPEPPRRLPIKPVLFCVLPIVIALAMILYVNRDKGDKPAVRGGQPAGVPDLGSRGKAIEAPAPADEESGDPTEGETTEPEEGGEDNPDLSTGYSADAIDTALRSLAIAVKSGNRKGLRLEQHWLESARPDELVDERITSFLEAEPNARVRLHVFLAYHGAAAAEAWALRCFERNLGKLQGTDTELLGGEAEELSAYLERLAGMDQLSAPVLDLFRTVISSERPQWALKALIGRLYRRIVGVADRELAEKLAGAAETTLKRGTIDRSLGEPLLAICLARYATAQEVSGAMRDAAFERYLVTCAVWIGVGMSGIEPSEPALLGRLKEVEGELLMLLREALRRPGREDFCRETITRLVTDARDYSHTRKIIDEGIERRDEYLPVYLKALGSVSIGPADIEKLAAAASDPDDGIARAAIAGLGASRLAGAEAELRRLLEQAAGPAQKSLALAALINRDPAGSGALVDEYLAAEKPSQLRAVAVAFVPDSDVDRLKRVVEEDASVTVRKAALTRLGALKDKKLVHFFRAISAHDSSPVLRQLAKKYRDELENR